MSAPLCRLEAAVEAIRSGAVPRPPPEAVFVGDGDFHAIGAEYLRYFVEVGGLVPSSRILDIGCGIGRMAAALLPYLAVEEAGAYHGIDPVPEGIAWCREAFAAYPHFRFEHVDVANDLYNPDGAVPDHRFTFPADGGSVDFAIATSVFTHMDEAGIDRYLAEVARVLAAGGRLFATAFLFDGPEPPPGPAPHLCFTERGDAAGDRWHVAEFPPLAAVAYRAAPFQARAEAILGRPVAVHPGRWRGGAGPWFQDLVLA